MTLLEKILLAIIAVILVGSFSFIAYKEHQMSVQLTETAQSMNDMKQLANGIARSQGQYATQTDLQNFAKQNKIDLAAIQDDLSKLNASVSGINTSVVISVPQNSNNVPSTGTTPNTSPQPTNTDTYGYLKNRQILQVDENFGNVTIPFGQIGFSAWNKNPWDTHISGREYDMTNVLGMDENGKQYVYNKFAIKSDGKSYDIPITNAKFLQEYPNSKLSFNPRLFLGLDAGVSVSKLPVQGEFAPSVSVGFLSYGKTKVTPDWDFAQVGVGFDAATVRPQIVITPVAYNLGQNISFLKNTYIAPLSGAVETDGTFYLGAGFRVGF
jgi:hypothetical protein